MKVLNFNIDPRWIWIILSIIVYGLFILGTVKFFESLK